MKTRVTGMAVLAVGILFLTSAAVRAQEPQTLVTGLKEERTLGPGDNHVYIITLQEGAAVIGEADQHGVDLVIDVYGPDGKLIHTVDSPNGTEGPEPIEVTAFHAGPYKLILHTLETTAKPGKYVMKIDRVLTVEENGQRLAEKNYPLALQTLWRAYLTDPKALDDFIATRKGKGPVIEEVNGDSRNVRVTYFYYGDENTEKVKTWGGPHGFVGGIQMTRFLRTPLFFASEIVPRDARFTYTFVATETRFVGPKGAIQVSYDLADATDPLNPDVFDRRSVLAMPSAPPQPYVVANDSIPHGKLTPAILKSAVLKEDRTLTIYTPPGYEGMKASDLLIVFDGEVYDGDRAVPMPTILDNLLAARKVGPVVAIFVKNVGHREVDLADSPLFADFIGKELVPWVRKNYRIKTGTGHVVATGGSLGGLAASYCAFRHPEAIGNALSLSGSYWITREWRNRPPWPLTLAMEPGDLITEFKKHKRLPLRFYIAVGRFEMGSNMLGTNRELRDVLMLKRYPVTYNEVDGEHDNIWWRGSLADGLISLLGQNKP